MRRFAGEGSAVGPQFARKAPQLKSRSVNPPMARAFAGGVVDAAV
jgi:hypothetical protein